MFRDQQTVTINNGIFNMMVSGDDRDIAALCFLSNIVSPSAFHNAGHSFEFPPKCHPGTRLAVLDRLKGWILGEIRTEQNLPILWLYGAAGSGKSCIAHSIAAWCQEDGVPLASFFFFRSDSTRNSSKNFVPTLAYNLARTRPTCKQIILDVMKSNPHICSAPLNIQFKRLVLEPLSSVAKSTRGPFVLIIDGLDECLQEEEQKAILRLFSQNPLTGIGMKILISSRPEYAIQSSFEGMPYIHTRLALSNEYTADEDIRSFLRDKFAEIKRNHPLKIFIPPKWPSSLNINTLVKKSSGQFIYAATVVKYVSSDRHSPVSALSSILGNTLPPGRRDVPFAELDAVYAYILKTAGERAHNIEAVLRVTALIILSHQCWSLHRENRLTQVTILADVLKLDKEVVYAILMDLAAMISCSDNGFEVYHASLGDFLFDRTRSRGLCINKPKFLSGILCRCLSILPRKSCIVWSILTYAVMHAQPTPAISQDLRSFSFVDSLNHLSPLTLSQSDFLHCVQFLYALSSRIMDVTDWQQPYRDLISTFDQWIAQKFLDCSGESLILKAQVASWCCRWDAKGWTWRIYDLKLYSNRFPLQYREIFCRGHGLVDDHWFALLFERHQLPLARARIFDSETLASGVLLCTHLLLQRAMTHSTFRFPNTKQQSSLLWIWRKRTYWRRARRQGQNLYLNQLGFRDDIQIAPHLSYPWKEEDRWIYTISSVLGALPQLLMYNPPPSRVAFALRLVFTLRSTEVRYASALRKVKKAIMRYLRRVAGLKRLAYVNAAF